MARRANFYGGFGYGFDPEEVERAFYRASGRALRFNDDPLFKYICQEAAEYFIQYRINLTHNQLRVQYSPDVKQRVIEFCKNRYQYWVKEGFVLPKSNKK